MAEFIFAFRWNSIIAAPLSLDCVDRRRVRSKPNVAGRVVLPSGSEAEGSEVVVGVVMEIEHSTLAMQMSDDSQRDAASARAPAAGRRSVEMRQLLQGVRNAALSATLEKSDELERLAREIDAARFRRTLGENDER